MIILLNGPPGCGKDTVAEYITKKYNFTHLQFKKNLIDVTKRFLKIEDENWESYYSRKDQKIICRPSPLSLSDPEITKEREFISIRQFMIFMAEEVLKPTFGKGIFAKNMLTTSQVWNENFVISDLGFAEEINQIMEETGAVRSKRVIVRIDREGCNFLQDSRDWVTEFDADDIFFGDFGERLFSERRNPENFLEGGPEFTEESSDIIKNNFTEAPFEYEITNNGTLYELYRKIDKILNHLEYHEKIISKFMWKKLTSPPYLKKGRECKILIVGYARHGKDTAAEIISKHTGLTFITSSLFACKKIIFPALGPKYGYTTEEECFEDRVNHREEWYDLICQYNSPNKSRLCEEILAEYDIYVGMRSEHEYRASAHLFDKIIHVDASKRVPEESASSCTLDAAKLREDRIVVKNNGSLEDLEKDVLERVVPLLFKKI